MHATPPVYYHKNEKDGSPRSPEPSKGLRKDLGISVRRLWFCDLVRKDGNIVEGEAKMVRGRRRDVKSAQKRR